jgi:hypothetical protein
MAFSSCLKQVEFLNPEMQLTYKGVHPLHGVEDGKLLDYDNDPLTCLDLNDPEMEAFDLHAHQAIPPELAETGEPCLETLPLLLAVLDLCCCCFFFND